MKQRFTSSLLVLFLLVSSIGLIQPTSVVFADAETTQPPPKDADFDTFNPLKIFNQTAGEEYYADPDELDTPAGIISRVLDFAFPLAGLILFVMLLWGGFEMLSGAATKKSLDAGRQRITAAILGFLLLFASFWIAQIIEVVFGVTIL